MPNNLPHHKSWTKFVYVVSVLLACLVSMAKSAEDLKSGFDSPPHQSLPQVLWMWMNGNITKEGITADLESMKKVGIGGALILDIGTGVTPQGPVRFLSSSWREMIQHATKEAARLNLELGIYNCAGYASSGGPWIQADQSMKRVVTSETTVTGPVHFEKALPKPKATLNYYKDVAVLAFPTPADNQKKLADFKKKTLDDPAPFQPFDPRRSNSISSLAKQAIVDVTAHLQPDGRLVWDVPKGRWTILRVGYTTTGQSNHPSQPEGRGLECDKLDPAAMKTHWSGMMTKILDDLGPLAGSVLKNVYIDSWESGSQNWTANFREQFQKRHGYDLLPFLPVFNGHIIESQTVTERFLWDFRRTVADLFSEGSSATMAHLSAQSGLALCLEPYGKGPFDSFSYGRHAGIPMGEFWIDGRRGSYATKLASSLSHVYDHPIAQAEAFTATPDDGKWQRDPYSLKRLGDAAFCQGINRFILHRYAHQPWLNRAPGMTMVMWGSEFERTNTWWDQSIAWMTYLARCQYLLQQGQFVADILFFTGEDSPNAFSPSKRDLPSGYDYDLCDSHTLLTLASVQNGRILLPSGMSYRILVLPERPTMTPALLKKIKDLVAQGATVLGPPPLYSPSLSDYPQCDVEVKKLANELWNNCDGRVIKEHAYGQGRVFFGKTITEALQTLGVKPDFLVSDTNAQDQIGFIHRRTAEADIYFVSNQTDAFQQFQCRFRLTAKRPELWHPDTGLVEKAPVFSEEDGAIRLPLRLDPSGSVFVIFRDKLDTEDHPASENWSPKSDTGRNLPSGLTIASNGQMKWNAPENGTGQITMASGKTLQVSVGNVPVPIELRGPWTLHFPPNSGAPNEVKFEELISWTDRQDPGVRYFSGTAVYSTTLQVPEFSESNDLVLTLDLGQVKNLARVRVDGNDLGILWKPPFRVILPSSIRPGPHRLEIEVTNLWPNRMIGDEQLPEDCEWGTPIRGGLPISKWPDWLLQGKPSPTGRHTFSSWKHWTKESPLLRSGLIGPVTLFPIRQVNIRLTD